MSGDILVLVEHRDGIVTEGTLEILGRARELASEAGVGALALLLAADAGPLADQLGGTSVLAVEDASLGEFSPSAYQATLAPIVRDREPLLVLAPNSGVGMDVAGGLSAVLGLPLAAFAKRIDLDGGTPVVTCQLYAGKIEARVRFRGGRGICTVVAGAYQAPDGPPAGSPTFERLPMTATDQRVRFRGLLRPEAGDVDITRETILVSVGRGIGEQDNIELVEALATVLGGAVSSSRPIADAGWLPRTRQVGKSGLRVKPKLYLALGISGAPEHLEGMHDAELIIAVNTDPRAPIFGVADYGAVADILDVVPALTKRLG
jgi:electron transfer flavoprotein alpha subunit